MASEAVAQKIHHNSTNIMRELLFNNHMEHQRSLFTPDTSNLWEYLNQVSARNIVTSLSSLPLKKILLTSGGLIMLLLITLRLIIVLGPLILLSSLTRQDNGLLSDFLRIITRDYDGGNP